MKILADENLHALLIEDLRNEGYEVFSMRETSSGIADTEIAALADGSRFDFNYRR